jgi:hypothetical protein
LYASAWRCTRYRALRAALGKHGPPLNDLRRGGGHLFLRYSFPGPG